MIECSSELIVAADSSKLGKNVFAKIADASKADVLVTTKSENTAELQALKKLGTKIFET